jgi:hypothetical protein
MCARCIICNVALLLSTNVYDCRVTNVCVHYIYNLCNIITIGVIYGAPVDLTPPKTSVDDVDSDSGDDDSSDAPSTAVTQHCAHAHNIGMHRKVRCFLKPPLLV